MSSNLKHPFIYVLELNTIVTPAKARLAFLSNMNRYHEFHFYCRHCGVKLSGKNITKPKLGDKNQQPNCSDWPNVRHKPNCQSLTINTTGGTGGTTGGGTPPNSDIFIPEYLTFEAPNFVINQPDIIPEEIDPAILNTAPVDFEITELKNPNATYLLSDVIEAYNWIINQRINDDESHKITLGNKGYPNKYTKLVRPLDKLVFTDNPVIYSGTFNLAYAANLDDNFYFYSLEEVKYNHRLKIVIPSHVSNGTVLEKSIKQLIELKQSNKSKRQTIKVKFYFTSYTLPPESVTKISKHNIKYNESVIKITNPYLIILNPIPGKDVTSVK